LLELLLADLNADRGFMALTGFEVGKYTPLAQVGYSRAALASLPTSDSTQPESALLKAEKMIHVRTGTSSLVGSDHPVASHNIHVTLIGHGEMIGFICLERVQSQPFEPSAIERLGRSIRLLTSIIAEQNFSIRVHRLAQAFRNSAPARNGTLDKLFDEIADVAALAFAADAVVLRIYHPDQEALRVAASKGAVSPELLVERRLGEHIAGKLLKDDIHDWAAISIEDAGAPSGLAFGRVERQTLLDSGVKACLIMRLASETSADDENKHIGTLAYHMRRPHRFSWRDLVLYRSFCQRAADAIALERQTLRLRKSKEDLELEHMLVLAQSSQVTTTDIFKLISHDLFHRSFHACATLDDYIRRVEKVTKKQGQETDLLREEGEKALYAATDIQSTLGKLRTMEQSANRLEIPPASQIKIKDVVDEVENVLSGPLSRNKITIRRNFSDDISLFGPHSIFVHVIFNLVINSIDAARTRTTSKPMSIHIHARREVFGNGPRVVIQFWDEGPGINRKRFRDPKEIFKIGVTTKPNGTGTGLPVTRHLLNTHFGGSIQLQDADKALFRLDLLATKP